MISPFQLAHKGTMAIAPVRSLFFAADSSIGYLPDSIPEILQGESSAEVHYAASTSYAR
jgi:hypothetical protein